MLGETCRGSQTQLAAGALMLGGQLGACPAGRFAHGCALDVEALAGIGQRQLARGAVQQRQASIVFQLTDMLADGRGRHVELAGGRAHAAALHHGGKNGHASEIFHEAILKCCFKVMVAERGFSRN